MLNAPMPLEPGSLFQLDVILRGKGSFSIVLSAHHALIDHKGMLNFMRMLNGKFDNKDFLPELNAQASFLKKLKDTWWSTLFMFKSTPRRLAKLHLRSTKPNLQTNFKTISFSPEQTLAIDKLGISHGARLGRSVFYLAAAIRSVYKVLHKHQKKEVVYWIPVPLNQRPLGASGSVLSNHLSFLFFRIPSVHLDSIEETIAILNDQMKQQIKDQVPKRYSNLMNFFKRVPLNLYLEMVKLPTRGAISSFSFSDLGESRDWIDEVLGIEVKDMHNYPPVPCPPGLTFAFMKYNGALRIIMGYVKGAISDFEMDELEEYLKQDLGPKG